MTDDPLLKVLKQVAGRQADARVVVLVTNGFIELIINTLVDHFCRDASSVIRLSVNGSPYCVRNKVSPAASPISRPGRTSCV